MKAKGIEMTNDVVEIGGVDRPRAMPPKKKVSSPTGRLISEASPSIYLDKPWWAEFPNILWKCILIVLFPLRALHFVADAAVTFAMVAVIAAPLLWYFGYIPDELLAKLLSEIGDRLMGVLSKTGVL